MKQRLEKLGAATALTGALLGTVACSNETTGVPVPEASVSIDDTPRERVGRCVLDASRLAILGVLDSPATVYEPAKSGQFGAYLYKPEGHGSQSSNVMVDDSVADQTSLVYYIRTQGDDGAELISSGKITLPVESGEAMQVLENLNPDSIRSEDIANIVDFEVSGITERSANGGTIAGTDIEDVSTVSQANADCAVAEDFAEGIRQEHGR